MSASPWGWKVTIHVYGSGGMPTFLSMQAASERCRTCESETGR